MPLLIHNQFSPALSWCVFITNIIYGIRGSMRFLNGNNGGLKCICNIFILLKNGANMTRLLHLFNLGDELSHYSLCNSDVLTIL